MHLLLVNRRPLHWAIEFVRNSAYFQKNGEDAKMDTL
jgi:hypothetical protein